MSVSEYNGEVSICVCVCTFRRPKLLRCLLSALQSQVTAGLFQYSIVVVDNDHQESARGVVQDFAAASETEIVYSVEPEQNIALARNRAVSLANTELVAMIDDDELPVAHWLLSLYKTLREYEADGVLGPVRPHYEGSPPKWLLRAGFCDRPSYATGTLLSEARQTRTGNVLFHKGILHTEVGPFDLQFGRTGGEDSDFFGRRLLQGDRFVWCEEAPVFEQVPVNRMTRSYFVRRALLRGVANGANVSFFSGSVAKSLLASMVYTAILPVMLIIRHDLFMRYLVRDCDHIGKVLAVCRIPPLRERDRI